MSRVADALKRSRTVGGAAGGEIHWPPLQSGPAAGGITGSLLGLSMARPGFEFSGDVRLVTCPASDMVAREQYRRMAVTLHQAHIENDLRTVMVTSAVPREGKSVTAVNLALTLAAPYGRRVLLIDADLHEPSVHALLRIENTSGLAETLLNDRPLSLVHVLPGLWVLPAGPPCGDPLGRLMTGPTRQLIDEARELFDWVIVDTPPVGVLPDANVLGAIVDATILVVAAGRTPHEQVQQAAETLGRGRVFGVVLNRVDEDAGDLHYGYYRDYARDRAGAPASSPQGPDQPDPMTAESA